MTVPKADLHSHAPTSYSPPPTLKVGALEQFHGGHFSMVLDRDHHGYERLLGRSTCSICCPKRTSTLLSPKRIASCDREDSSVSSA